MMNSHRAVLSLVLGTMLSLSQLHAFAQQNEVPVNEPKEDTTQTENLKTNLGADEIKDLVRRVAENDISNNQKAKNYTFIQRTVQRKLDGDGSVKSTETKTFEIMQLYGEQVARLIEKDDKPLSDKDAAKEEEKIQKVIKKRSGESEQDRNKRLEKQAKDREEARKFVKEICDAYDMKVSGTDNVDGHEVLIIDGNPRPDFQPKMKDAKYLKDFKLRAWIDPQMEQWVKLDAEAIDNISWGAFLVKINKGMHLQIQQTHVNDDIWLPQRLQLKLGGRALFKSLNYDIDVTFRDYRKFRTDVKISEPTEISERQ